MSSKTKSEQEWRTVLSPQAFKVLRQKVSPVLPSACILLTMDIGRELRLLEQENMTNSTSQEYTTVEDAEHLCTRVRLNSTQDVDGQPSTMVSSMPSI